MAPRSLCLLFLTAGLAACATAGRPPVDPVAWDAARRPLGPVDAVAADPAAEHRRLKTIGRLALEAGHAVSGHEAFRALVHRARVGLALAPLTGDDAAAAQARYDEARRLTWAAARELQDVDLVARIHDYEGLVDDDEDRALLVQAAQAWSSQATLTRAALATDPAPAVALRLTASLDEDDDDALYPFAEADLDPRAVAIVEARFLRAAAGKDDARAAKWARQLADLDPLHPGPALWQAAAPPSGPLPFDAPDRARYTRADVLRALLPGRHEAVAARLFLAHHGDAADPAARLALAVHALRRGLGGDAQALADDVAAAAPELLPWAERVSILARISMGDEAAVAAIEEDAERSYFFALLVLRHLPAEGVRANPAARRVATRAVLREALPFWISRKATVATLLDPDASDRARDEARRRLSTGAAPYRRITARCEAAPLDAEACLALFVAMDTLVDPSEGELSVAEALLRVQGHLPIDPDWLAASMQLNQAGLLALAPILPPLEGSSMAGTRGGSLARILVAIAEERFDDARRDLERDGARLTREERIAVRLALHAVTTDGADVEAVLNRVYPPRPLSAVVLGARGDDAAVEGVRAQYPSPDAISRLLRLQRFVRMARPEPAARELDALRPALPTDETALLTGWLDLARFEVLSGDARRAFAESRLDSPVPVVAARAHEALGRAMPALWTQPLLQYPWSRAATRAVVASAPPRPTADVFGFLETLAPLSWAARNLLETGRALPTPPPWAELVAALDDPAGARAWADRAPRGTQLQRVLLQEATRRLAEATTATAAEAAAQDRLELLDASQRRDADAAWSVFLAGAAEDLRFFGTEAGPLVSGHAVRRLAALRPRLDGTTAFAVWRAFGAEREEEARPLAAVQALARAHPDDAQVAALSCRALVDANLPDAALEPCRRAWRSVQDPDLAAAASWLARVRGEDAARAGVGPTEMFGGARRLAADYGEVWLFNRSPWAAEQGRATEAARDLLVAWALGMSLDDGVEASVESALLEVRAGWVLRWTFRSAYEHEIQRLLGAGWYAAKEARPTVAAAYLEPFSRRDPATLEAKQATPARGTAELVVVAREDIAAGHLTAEAFGTAFAALEGNDAKALAALRAAHPQATLLALIQVELALARVVPLAAAKAEGEALLAQRPDLRVLRQDLVNLHLLSGDLAAAKACLRAGLERDPDDVDFTRMARRIGLAPAAPPPDYLASSDALLAALSAAATPEKLTRFVDPEVGLEVFLPEGFELLTTAQLPFRYESKQAGFVQGARFPRMSRCEPAACLQSALSGIEQAGFETIWKAELSNVFGPAAWALTRKDGRSVLLAAVPRGARVYLVSFGGPHDVWTAHLGAFALAWDTMRPLELAVLSEWAEAMRGALGWRMPDGATRARARRAALEAGVCPLRDVLGEVPDYLQAGLLLDVYLATPEAAARRALIRCARPDADAAAHLGVPTLLEESDALHRYGVAVATAQPAPTVRMAEAALRTETTATPTEGAFDRPRAPYGALQVLVALPTEARHRLGGALLSSLDKEAHALGLAAHVFAGDVATVDVLAADIRSAPPGPAFLATLAAERGGDAATESAARDRLDALGQQVSSDADLRLAGALVALVAGQVEARDGARLRRVAERAEASEAATDEPELAEGVARYARAHARAVKGRLTPKPDDGEARRDARLARRLLRERDAPFEAAAGPSAEALATESLFRFLPRGRWMISRLPQPDLLVSTSKVLFENLDFGEGAQSFLLRRALSEAVKGMGAGALEGGIDLSSPMTCAQRGFGDDFVCSARVKDASRIRDAFGRRGRGKSAAALPVAIAPVAFAAPVALAAVPFIVHFGLFPDDDDDDAERKSDARVLSERVRAPLTIGPHSLERFARLDVRERSGVIVQEELYLFVKDRLLVFSSEEMARTVLSARPEAEALSTAPALRWALERNRGGAILLASLSDEPSDDFTASMAIDSQGATFVMHGRDPSDGADVNPLLRHLPAAPASLIALAFGTTEDFGPSGDWLSDPPETMGTKPPLALLTSTRALAFGWYPTREAPMWHRWVAALPYDRAVKAALSEAKAPRLSRGRAVTQDGLTYLVEGGVLRVGRPAALVTSGPRLETSDRPAPLVIRLDAAQAGEALEGLFSATEIDVKRRGGLGLAQRILQATRRLDATAETDRAGDLVRGRLEFATRPTGADDAELEVVASWLRSPKNALALPPGAKVDAKRPMTFVLRTPDPKAAKRAFEGRPRNQVEVLAPDRVRVRIASKAADPTPLDDKARKRALGETGLVHPGSSRVRRVAEQLSGTKPSDKAEAVVGWVRGNLTYELTQEALGAHQILSRRTGDCTEYSVVATSLLRSMGVPAELREGFMASGGQLVAHAWVAYHDGETWKEIDPTNGLLTVGATHLESSVADLVGLLTLERLELVSAEASGPEADP